MDPAHRRALKLAIGTALALLYSQWVNWGQAYITAVLTATILALPLPAPSLRTAGAITVALMIALLTGLCLLLPIHYMATAGVILIGLGLFGIFYYGARGGSAIIVSFMTIGLAVVPALGSESIDGAVMISQSLVKAIVAGIGFVWRRPRPSSRPCRRPGPDCRNRTGHMPWRLRSGAYS